MQSLQDLGLKDIHAAPAPPWWPPAWGWWVAAAALLVLLVWLAVLTSRWLARRRYRRRLLAEVDHVVSKWQSSRNDREAVARLSVLLRRLLVRAGGRAGLAAAVGQKWSEALGKPVAGNADLERAAAAMASAPYQPDPPPVDVHSLADLARAWAKEVSRV